MSNANVNLGILIGAKDQNATGTIDRVTGSVNRLDKAAGSTRGLSALANLLKVGVAAAATAAVGAIVGLGAGIVKTTMEAAGMEQGIANIAAVMGATKEEAGQLKNLVMNLGIDPKLKVSASEAAGAVEMLARNGVQLDDILNGVARSTILLSNATGADYSTAADIATDAMAIFKIRADEVQRAVNGIVGVTNSSKFSIDDYALALGSGAKGASAAGVSFEQFNQTITAISSNFTSGRTAGTALTQMLIGLSPKSKAAATAMKELGIITAEGQNRFFDLNGEVRSNAEISDILRQTLGRLAPEQRLTAVNTIFGVEAMAAINGMISTTTEQWNKYGAALSNTDAEGSAAIRMNTLSGALSILRGLVETLRIQIGEKFIPVFRSLTERASQLATDKGPMLVEWAGQLAAKIEWLLASPMLPALITKMRAWFEMVMNTAGAIWLITKNVGNFISGIISSLSSITEMVGQFVTWKDVLIGLGAVLTMAILPGIVALVTAFAPVAGIFAAVVAASAALRVAWNSDFLGIRTITENVVKWLSEKFLPIFDMFRSYGGLALKELVAWAQGNDTQLKWVSYLWTNLKAAVSVTLLRIRDLLSAAVTYVVQQIPAWRAALAGWAVAAWKWVVDVTPTVLDALGKMLSAIKGWAVTAAGAIGTASAGISESLAGWAVAAWQWIADATPVALTKLGEWFVTIGGWLARKLPEFVATFLSWSAAAWQWVGDTIPSMIDAFGDWLSSILTWNDTEGQPGIGGMVKGWATTLWRWITDDVIPVIGPELLKLGEAILTALAKLTVSVAVAAAKIGVALLTAIAEALLDLVGIDVNLDQIRRTLFDTLDGWKSQIFEQGAAVIERIGAGMRQALQDPVTAISNIIGAISATFTSWLGNSTSGALADFLKAGGDLAKRLGSGITQFLSDPKTALGNMLSGVKSTFESWRDGTAGMLAKMLEGGKSIVTKLGEGLKTLGADANGHPAKNLGDLLINLDASVTRWLNTDGVGARLVRAAGETITRTLGAGIAAILSGDVNGPIQKLLSMLDGITQHLYQWMGTETSGGLQSFLEGGKTMIRSLGNGIQQITGEWQQNNPIAGPLGWLANSISNWVNESWTTFIVPNASAFGNAIVRAIGDAIIAGSQTLKDALQYLVNLLPQWAKDILGIGTTSASASALNSLAQLPSIAGLSLNSAAATLDGGGGFAPFAGSTTNNSSSVAYQFMVQSPGRQDRDLLEEIRQLNMLYAGA